MGDWRMTTWGDVITLQRGFDITKSEQVLDGDIPVVSSGGVSSHHNVAVNDGPGVVIGRKGTLGRVYYVDGPFWPHDTTLWVRDFNDNNPRFVYYALKAIDPAFLNVGSASPTLNRNHFHPLPVRWPESVVDQEAIADVLGALDDKIAANDCTLQTSALLARAFFRGAAMDGLRVRIDQVASLITRGAAPKYVDSNGLTVLNQKCVRDQWVDLRQARVMQPLQSRHDRMLCRDDVLVNSTGYGTLGRVARWTNSEITATVDSHITIVRFDESAVDPACAGFAMLLLETQIEQLAEGSTGQTELRRDLLGALELQLPSSSAQQDLGQKLREIDELALTIRAESARLAATRDELLPLLMSGKIRVRDAEKIVEEAV